MSAGEGYSNFEWLIKLMDLKELEILIKLIIINKLIENGEVNKKGAL